MSHGVLHGFVSSRMDSGDGRGDSRGFRGDHGLLLESIAGRQGVAPRGQLESARVEVARSLRHRTWKSYFKVTSYIIYTIYI